MSSAGGLILAPGVGAAGVRGLGLVPPWLCEEGRA